MPGRAWVRRLADPAGPLRGNRMSARLVPVVVGLTAAALLAGCAVGPDFERPPAPAPSRYPPQPPRPRTPPGPPPFPGGTRLAPDPRRRRSLAGNLRNSFRTWTSRANGGRYSTRVS